MNRILLIILLTLGSYGVQSQSCDELMSYVKSESYGTTYNSYTSTAISKVTFYTTTIDYKTFYFAIVCFKSNEYSYNCSEYIYKVSSMTMTNYALNYLDGAGEAFWKYIQPYADNLDCSPNFD
ncbi:hypothetical protein [uncultured Formosa sp.]|uniref:hypothetical protein n=1 Tax=uncultured Formosa sp. TaxID=255435 RepID=UPI002620E2BB|nr:hypothetical protein [uncultured Formosa sp.]